MVVLLTKKYKFERFNQRADLKEKVRLFTNYCLKKVLKI